MVFAGLSLGCSTYKMPKHKSMSIKESIHIFDDKEMLVYTHKGDVAKARLDRSVIRAVHVNQKGQLLLTEPSLVAKLTAPEVK